MAVNHVQELQNSSQEMRDGIDRIISGKSEDILEDAESATSNFVESVWHAFEAAKHSLNAVLRVQKVINVLNHSDFILRYAFNDLTKQKKTEE